MPLALDQSERFIQCTTTLGDNKLLATAFRGVERISRPFHLTVEMVSSETGLPVQDLVGSSFTLSVLLPDGENMRYFNGVVLRASAGETSFVGDEDVRVYRAEIVPSLYLMRYKTQCRVFQNVTLQNVVTELWSEHGFSTSDLQTSLGNADLEMEYCVQYNESNFDFLSRLLERFGVYYYFTHADGSHKTVFADAASNYGTCDEGTVETARFAAVPGQITRWERGIEFTSGKYSHTDYNFEDPGTDLLADSPTALSDVSGRDNYEVYEYPGNYQTTGDGSSFADVRMGELEVPDTVVKGAGTCPSFFAGGVFNLSEHPVEAEQGDFVLTEVRHEGFEPTLSSPARRGRDDDDEDDERPFYKNEFECIPDKRLYRPPRIAPVPRIDSLQTAVVVGSTHNEPHTDKYGRVQVKFHWFRSGEFNADSLCYVRVAQFWAGAERGALFVPRVDDEVVVAFLDGNPDRPLIVGSVYNEQRMPPWDFSTDSNWLWSGIKSQSSDGQNELRFEDSAGAELALWYAFKDSVRVVGNKEVVRVGFSDTVASNGTASTFVDDSGAEDGDQHVTVAQNRTVVVDGGDDLLEVSQGDLTVDVKSGQCNITAASKIVLTCGESVIEMSPSEIKITGTKITVTGSASGTFDGGGTTDVKGGIVNIN